MKLTIREARREHRCFNCNEIIYERESHYQSNTQFDGNRNDRLCKQCGINWIEMGAQEENGT